MGQDVEGMGYGERAICLSLFVCLAVAVFSTVSLIYLTSIVYVPVQNELEAGFVPEPVMCTSTLAEKARLIFEGFPLARPLICRFEFKALLEESKGR